MTMKDRVAETNRAADVIGRAIAKKYRGVIDVYAVLGGLSTIAADIISTVPESERKALLEAWDESPAYVRSIVHGKH